MSGSTLITLASIATMLPANAPSPNDYSQQVAPILNRYCVACHNAEDREGGLSLDSFSDLNRGGKRGPAFLPGRPDMSRLVRVLTGDAEPRMPPDESEQPSAEEIATLREWIAAGGNGPDGAAPEPRQLLVPRIDPPIASEKRISAVAHSESLQELAVAAFGRIELRDRDTGANRLILDRFPGKVNAVHFSSDGSLVVAASGVTGLYGHASLRDVQDGSLVREFAGHSDILYDAELSPDGRTLATCSYDHKVILWDASSGEMLRTLAGHNGAVYDVAFSPDSTVVASASGDETVKLWEVATGERLDTLSQPQAEQYTVTFSPNGEFVLAGGADNRIRVWRFVSKKERRINPLEFARFAHQGAIVELAFSADGRHLASTAEDRSLKLWETQTFTETHLYEKQSDLVTGIALTAGADLFVTRVDGSLSRYPIMASPPDRAARIPANATGDTTEAATNRVFEHEPNDGPTKAMRIALPAQIDGSVQASPSQSSDADWYRFSAQAGEEWVLEVNAARQKSQLDSRIEVLTDAGEPIERVLLQATRDSYFTFRGKDSSTIDDFRLHNWEEMEINEYLYAGGEVVKLWHYPRGPDSGFQVYPGNGKRFGYFDTTAISHALHAQCYVVQPHPPGSGLIPNGLPIFRLFYENDDDSQRELGSDSRLTFRAPQDGQYLVRITDARGFSGPDFGYTLMIRRRRPDFDITLEGTNLAVSRGGGQEFLVHARRIDGFDGEISITVADLPPGFHASSPLSVEAGQTRAIGIIYADPDAVAPHGIHAKSARVHARAVIGGEEIVKQPISLGEVKLAEDSQLTIHIANAQSKDPQHREPVELTLAPGQTISANVSIERNGFEGRVGFGTADAGRNLPHGVFVDNIGLNGLLIIEGQQERTFFITAAPWVGDTSRLFHLRADVKGKVTSLPVMLHVRRDRERLAEVDEWRGK